MKCEWLIASQTEIRRSFAALNVEAAYDVVTVNRYSTASFTGDTFEEIARVSGNYTGEDLVTYKSSTGYLQVVFTSDENFALSGFVTDWRIRDPEAAGLLTSILHCTCVEGYSRESPTRCTACSPGKYKLQGNGACTSCTSGTYSPDTAKTNCTVCPPNSWSHLASTQCKCVPGHTSEGSECVPCLPASYKATDSDGSCTPCPQNVVSNLGSASLHQCV